MYYMVRWRIKDKEGDRERKTEGKIERKSKRERQRVKYTADKERNYEREKPCAQYNRVYSYEYGTYFPHIR